MSKFYIHTFGCRCNQADSASLRAALGGSRDEAENHGEADLVVVNSCTVTHRSDRQVRQAVRKLHRENPRARLVVTGCYAERDPQTIASIPGVNLVVGNADKGRLVEILEEEDPSSGGRIVRGPLDPGRDYLVTPASQTGSKTRPFIKLQDGCDARCSYCVIPAVRGPGRSGRPDDILNEIRVLVDHGYQEIVLTGVHLGTYGRRLDPPTRLVDLLERILETPGLGRLRLSSIEPMRFSRGIVRLAVTNRAFAPHFHIPLQSGSDRILRRMRRPYTAARFEELLAYIRAQLPAAAIGTDVMVAFPGETDRDFEETCDLVRRSPLTYLHVFPFSAREGTDAYSMPDRVPPQAARERARALQQISLEKNLAFRRGFLGKVIPAITLAKEEAMGDAVVLTENYIHARIPAGILPPNRLIDVRIEDVRPDTTCARPASA